jgi:hypothetical protein
MRPRIRNAFPLVTFTASIVFAQTWLPFAGTWKLNMEKSQFSPAPAMRSATVTFKDGQEIDEGIRADGLPFRWSHPIPAGEEFVPVTGIENTTISTKIVGRTYDAVLRVRTGVEHLHGVLSKDGKTLTVEGTGTDKNGESFHDVYVYEKQ